MSSSCFNSYKSHPVYNSSPSSSSTSISVHDKVIDLYLNFKVRTEDEVSLSTPDTPQLKNFDSEQLMNERERLCDIDTNIILEYIRSSVDILINMKIEDHMEAAKEQAHVDGKQDFSSNSYETNEDGGGIGKDYEDMLIKLEGDVRNHIRVSEMRVMMKIE